MFPNKNEFLWHVVGLNAIMTTTTLKEYIIQPIEWKPKHTLDKIPKDLFLYINNYLTDTDRMLWDLAFKPPHRFSQEELTAAKKNQMIYEKEENDWNNYEIFDKYEEEYGEEDFSI